MVKNEIAKGEIEPDKTIKRTKEVEFRDWGPETRTGTKTVIFRPGDLKNKAHQRSLQRDEPCWDDVGPSVVESRKEIGDVVSEDCKFLVRKND